MFLIILTDYKLLYKCKLVFRKKNKPLLNFFKGKMFNTNEFFLSFFEVSFSKVYNIFFIFYDAM